MTHVLIVEDQEENRNLLTMLLVANGYRVTAAGDGAEALDAARRDRPDLIVSDVLMPKMDGFTLCRAWMQDAGLSAIPFIFYSGTYVRPEDEQFAAALGAVRYLIKPVEAEVFLAELSNVLQQWAGHAAPDLASPLDETASHALHESALARKVEDKMAQLEAANRKLREGEEKYRRIYDNLQDVYVEATLEGTILEISAPIATLSRGQYKKEELIGKSVDVFYADSQYREAILLAMKQDGRAIDMESVFRNRDGSLVPCSVSATIVRDADGKLKSVGTLRDISKRKQAERELVEAEARFRSLVEQSFTGIFVIQDQKLSYCNPRFVQILGYTSEAELIGKDLLSIAVDRDVSAAADTLRRLFEEEAGPVSHAFAAVRKDGSIIEIELQGIRALYRNRPAILGMMHDISERKAADAKIHRQTQLYAALSQCNEAIVRCASEKDLFPKVCRAAVQFGGMKMAWIGLINSDTRMVHPVASFGNGTEYLQVVDISLDADSPLARGPTSTAIRENQPFWCQDFLNEPVTTPWHERGARHGWAASASLPLHRKGVVIGAFTLYSGEINSFDESARGLLIEMAQDISFALDNFARESERIRGAQELLESELRFRGLVEQTIAGIYIIQDGKLAYVNPHFAQILGYDSAEELIGRDGVEIIADKDGATVLDYRRQLIDGEAQPGNRTCTALKKDGASVEVEIHGTRATYRNRPAVIGLIQDISERKRAEEKIQRYVGQLKAALLGTVEVATILSEMRDPYTSGHERRVAEIAVAIGAELGFDAHRQEGLQVAGHLHDVGKINIPSEILSKPGKLSAIEFQLIKGHAQASYDALKGVEFPWPVAQVALQHHERMDGSGYPQGLKGEAILLEARIMAVADVVEAMSSHRPYRAGLGIERALAEIEAGRGTAYDADAADACLRLFREKRYQLPV